MHKTLLLIPLTAALLSACNGTVTPPTAGSAPSATAPSTPGQSTRLGQVDVTFTVDRSGQLTTQARTVPQLGQQGLSSAPVITVTTPALSQSSFTTGDRTSGNGQRYLSATFAVNNGGSTPLGNVSLIAQADATTTAGTAIKDLLKFDGTPVANAAALARSVKPTQSVYFDGTQPQTIEETADLQVFLPADLSAFPASAGQTLLPYGYVAHNGSSRTLAPSPNAGRVTVSVKVPLQASASEDAFSFTMRFEVVTDSVTRVTQALEEQGSEDHAAVQARAVRFGASEVTVLPGSTYALGTVTPVCSVPLNVPDATTAYLVNTPVTGVVLDQNRKLLTRNLNTRVPATVTYGSGASATLLLNLTTSGAALSSAGGFVKGLSAGTGTINAAACGVNSADLAVRVIGRPTIGAGSNYSVVLKPDGTLRAWGFDNGGTVNSVPGGNVEGVYAGDNAAFAIRPDGSVTGWGNDSYGQVTLPSGLKHVLGMATSYYHTLGLNLDGTVVGWGYNGYYQSDVPVGLNNVVGVSSGNTTSYAIRGDGSVVAWGTPQNYGSGQSDAVPFNLSGVVAMAHGLNGQHHLALKFDGTVVGWGNNSSGLSTIPAGLNNVVAIAESAYAAYALKSDGTVVAWGSNIYAGSNYEVPSGLSNVVAIAASPNGYHVLALKSDGSLVSWGGNTYSGSPLEVPVGLTAQLP